jgi:hypothetical protein
MLKFSFSNVFDLIFRRYARLHPKAANCRKKKCGHSNAVRLAYFFNFSAPGVIIILLSGTPIIFFIH